MMGDAGKDYKLVTKPLMYEGVEVTTNEEGHRIIAIKTQHNMVGKWKQLLDLEQINKCFDNLTRKKVAGIVPINKFEITKEDTVDEIGHSVVERKLNAELSGYCADDETPLTLLSERDWDSSEMKQFQDNPMLVAKMMLDLICVIESLAEIKDLNFLSFPLMISRQHIAYDRVANKFLLIYRPIDQKASGGETMDEHGENENWTHFSCYGDDLSHGAKAMCSIGFLAVMLLMGAYPDEVACSAVDPIERGTALSAVVDTRKLPKPWHHSGAGLLLYMLLYHGSEKNRQDVGTREFTTSYFQDAKYRLKLEEQLKKSAVTWELPAFKK